MKEWEQFIDAHTEVKQWLKNRPDNTRRIFAYRLQDFCQAMKITPEKWRDMDKFKARDLAWKYVQDMIKEHSSVASVVLVTLKSFYRNKDGEQLPLDSNRGGKHYLHVVPKKAGTEHIPSKTEVFQLIDVAGNLRDKAILLFLFQSGCRVNVLQHITYGHIADQLENDTVPLKITGDLDHKLRSRDIPYYYTFLNGEGSDILRQYCELYHKEKNLEKPLFGTKGNKPISQSYVLRIVKRCAKLRGMDPNSLWTHSLRKSFRKIVRQADIDDDDKEQLMGHMIRGSRDAYYDKNDVELIQGMYQKCNFSRELPKSELKNLKTKVALLERENVDLKIKMQETAQPQEIENLKAQVANLTNIIATWQERFLTDSTIITPKTTYQMGKPQESTNGKRPVIQKMRKTKA